MLNKIANKKNIFTEKQTDFIRAFKCGQLKRLNLLEGSVRSGKTWISLVAWAFWVANMPEDNEFLMCGQTLTTLKRNVLYLLEDLVGSDSFTYSLSLKEGFLFGRKVYFEGSNDVRSEGKIRGLTLAGAYCDELTNIHVDFYKMLLSRLSEPNAKLFATTNPDHPKHWVQTDLIQRKNEISLFTDKFLIDDNTFLDEEYVKNIKREYVGVFYDRFILGRWVVAEGAIYRIFSDNKERYYIDSYDKIRRDIVIGVDFGGTKSAHTFVAAGINFTGADVVYLASERHDAVNINPEQLGVLFCNFVKRIEKTYGYITCAYADSAEQTLIRGLNSSLEKHGVYNFHVLNAWKTSVVDRIRLTLKLMAQGRLKIIKNECQTLSEAFEGAVWDSKKLDDSRLDDGTSDIDTLDAAEYCLEPYSALLASV